MSYHLIKVIGLYLVCSAFSCSSGTEPEQIPNARLRFHVDSSRDRTAHITVSEVDGNGYQVEADLEVPGVLDLPLPAGTFSTRVELGENYVIDRVVLDPGMELDIQLPFFLSVVRAQLPDIFVGETVNLELRSALCRFQSAAAVRVPRHGRVEWTFPYALSGRYSPQFGRGGGSCPTDSVDLEVGGIVVADLVTPGQISWNVNAPWSPVALDSVRIEITSFPDRIVASPWRGTTAHIRAELPCGTSALLVLSPQHGIQVKESRRSVSTSIESDPSIWDLGGLEIELITTNQRDSFELGIGSQRTYPMTGSSKRQWLLNPGNYELDYLPSRPGLMPPHQSFRPDPEDLEVRLIDLKALASTSVVWAPLEGGTISGEFLESFEEGDRLEISSSGGSSQWGFELQEDHRHFEIHHAPIGSFNLGRSRVVNGRTETWWFPGTSSPSEAVDLQVEDKAVLSGVVF